MAGSGSPAVFLTRVTVVETALPGVKTQSEGSELGSWDGYEQVLIRVMPEMTTLLRSRAIWLMLQVACVSAASNWPVTGFVITHQSAVELRRSVPSRAIGFVQRSTLRSPQE